MNCSLTDKTRNIINAETLSVARPGLHLINVARGGLIEEKALLAALDSGKLAAATIDVTLPEPLPAEHIFFRHPAIRLTPHISGMSEDFEDRLSAKLLDNLDRYMSDKPLTEVVDLGRGY
jgi:phosphoglycerate dehydrogenase-like enzyme